MEYGVTDTGFNVKGFNAIQESLENRARSLWDDDIDLSEGSVLRKLIDTISLEIARLWDTSQHVYSSSFVEEATGDSLDRIGMLVGVYRDPATFAEGIATFEGDEGLTIDEGFTIQTNDGVKYATTESGEIDSSEELELNIRALRPGSNGNVSSLGVVNEFVDHKSGVTSVENTTTIDGGEDRETDSDLRIKIRNAIEVRAKATESAVKRELLDIDGVTSVSLQENFDRSVLLYIGGIGDKSEISDELSDEIDEAIDNVRAFGIPFSWDTPTHSDITIADIYSSTGDLLSTPEDFRVEVTREDTDEAKETIVDNIMGYINSLDVNEDVVYRKIIGVIYNSGDWVYDVKGMYIAKNYTDEDLDDVFSKDNISIALEEKASIEEDDIMIEVVEI